MLAVLMRFRATVRAMRNHYRRVEHACGISGPYVWAMVEIAANGGMSVAELAHTLAIHQSTASNMVDKLETSRLIDRSRDPADGRVVQLRLTALGRRTIKRAPAPQRGVLQEALRQLPMRDLLRLGKDLELLLAKMHAGRGGEQTLLLAQLAGGEMNHTPRKSGPKRKRTPRGLV